MLIAIEGIDGSGKGTQGRLLLERARREGLRAELLAFPMYDRSFFGREIGRYLNGEFGDLWSVHPKLAATLYAGDRHESAAEVRRLLETAELVICDRYTASNQAHQAAKLPAPERAEFFEWVERLEHEVLGVPRPDRVLFLDLPPEVTTGLVEKKAARSYTDRKADIHEGDAGYLGAVHAAYRELSARPEWVTISCIESGEVLPIDAVHERVWAEARRP